LKQNICVFSIFSQKFKKRQAVFQNCKKNKIGKQKTALNFGRTPYPNWQKQSVEKK